MRAKRVTRSSASTPRQDKTRDPCSPLLQGRSGRSFARAVTLPPPRSEDRITSRASASVAVSVSLSPHVAPARSVASTDPFGRNQLFAYLHVCVHILFSCENNLIGVHLLRSHIFAIAVSRMPLTQLSRLTDLTSILHA